MDFKLETHFVYGIDFIITIYILVIWYYLLNLIYLCLRQSSASSILCFMSQFCNNNLFIANATFMWKYEKKTRLQNFKVINVCSMNKVLFWVDKTHEHAMLEINKTNPCASNWYVFKDKRTFGMLFCRLVCGF